MSIIQEALKKIDPPDRPVSKSERITPALAAERSSSAERSQSRNPDAFRKNAVPAERPLLAAKSAAIPVSSAFLRPVIGAAILLAALIALIALAAFFRSGARKADTIPAPVSAAGPLSPAVLPSHQETIYKRVEPVTVVRSEPPDLILNGIMYLETGPRALINNAIVGAGDTVNGATVTAINKKSVILTYNNVEITLNLK
jgi:hypothetical protein